MIDRPPENKGLNPAKPPPEAVRKAHEDFAKVVDRIADAEVPKPPAGPKIVGHGTCPRCFVEGGIYVLGTGTDRHLKYVGCRCPKK